MYISKLEALLEYHNSRDTIDKVVMWNCPTKTQYDASGTYDVQYIQKASLHLQNKQACTSMVIGQDTYHGLTLITKTKHMTIYMDWCSI